MPENKLLPHATWLWQATQKLRFIFIGVSAEPVGLGDLNPRKTQKQQSYHPEKLLTSPVESWIPFWDTP